MMQDRPFVPRALVLFLMVGLATACSGGGSGDDDDDDDDDDSSVDLDQYLADNQIQRMEVLEDGTERGVGTTDDAGVVRFYSGVHEGVFDFAVTEDQVDGPVGGIDVVVSVGAETAVYWLEDPNGVYDPMFFVTDVPDADGELEVRGADQLTADGGVLEFDPAEGDPFAPPFTFIGITFTLNIRSVLVGFAVGAALEAFKSIVEETCKFFAPVHGELCRLVANVTGAVAGAALGAFRLGAVQGWTIARDIAGDLLGDMVCEPLAQKIMVGYVLAPDDKSMRDRYREVARKYNYILYSLEESPPPNGAELWQTLEDDGVALTQVGRVVRDRYFELYNHTNPTEGAQGYAFGGAANAIKEMTADANFRAIVLRSLTIAEGYREILGLSPQGVTYSYEAFRYSEVRYSDIRWSESAGNVVPEALGPLVNCAMSIAKGATIGIEEAGARRDVEIDVKAAVGHMLDILELRFDTIWADNWGGVIPPGDCLADEYEPNGDWESAFANPVPVELVDDNVISLQELTLCDYIGAGSGEEDWYGYYISPIELNVEARVLGQAHGANEEVCVEIYFFSEIYTILEPWDPPTYITGACGVIDAGVFGLGGPATEPFGVRRTVGEQWSMLFIRVLPGASATGSPIDYELRFTP